MKRRLVIVPMAVEQSRIDGQQGENRMTPGVPGLGSVTPEARGPVIQSAVFQNQLILINYFCQGLFRLRTIMKNPIPFAEKLKTELSILSSCCVPRSENQTLGINSETISVHGRARFQTTQIAVYNNVQLPTFSPNLRVDANGGFVTSHQI